MTDRGGGEQLSGDWPRSVSEAVDRLIAGLAPEDIETVRGWGELDLSAAHFGLGLWIRNNFGLRARNDALLDSCWREQHGGSRPRWLPAEPDGASQVILRALRDRLVKEGTERRSVGKRADRIPD